MNIMPVDAEVLQMFRQVEREMATMQREQAVAGATLANVVTMVGEVRSEIKEYTRKILYSSLAILVIIVGTALGIVFKVAN